MTSYREQTLHAKAARAGIVEQRPVGGKSAKPRPVIVEQRASPKCRGPMLGGMKDWRKWRAYCNEVEAQAAMDAQRRKYDFYEFRIKPEARS